MFRRVRQVAEPEAKLLSTIVCRYLGYLLRLVQWHGSLLNEKYERCLLTSKMARIVAGVGRSFRETCDLTSTWAAASAAGR